MEKKALVIGLGLSGRSAMAFLLHHGYEVTGVDVKDLSLDSEIQNLVDKGAQVFTEDLFLHDTFFPLVIPSPGIAPCHPLIQRAQEKGAKILGEAELAFSHFQGRAVAITGTNGKTTVTLLIAHVLKAAGKKASALGNVGVPLTRHLLQIQEEEIVVAELSSYQLETFSSQVFDSAVILNVTPDHLDRYPDFTAYAQAKAHLQKTLKSKGKLYLSQKIMDDFSDLFSQPVYLVEDLSLPLEAEKMAKHDEFNALAAWALCRDLGVKQEEFLEALKTFKKPSHRIEFVLEINGVSYYDDSKGTNVDAVIQAVRAMKGPVILIGGGVDKGSSYLPWIEFQGKVKEMIFFGQAASKMAEELALFFNVQIVDSLKEAVQLASFLARRGDFVLLSPGCSSFDMFRDYAHRGSEFQRFVNDLAST